MSQSLTDALGYGQEGGQDLEVAPAKEGDAEAALAYQKEGTLRFHPEMLDWVAGEIGRLVHDEGVAPREIAVLAPFLSGALRFSLAQKLAARGVAVRSHRPSRALREEPATTCLLTLAALCHPGWTIHPSRAEVAHALMLTIRDMDLVRAHLLAEVAYHTVAGRRLRSL